MSDRRTLADLLRERLVQSDRLEESDAIFVLAGHRNRKVFGARLFRDGWASNILMSTGNPPYIARVLEVEVEAADTSARASARLSQIQEASRLPPPPHGHFFACFSENGWSVESIPIGWLGTLSEIKALADWLRQHQQRDITECCGSTE